MATTSSPTCCRCRSWKTSPPITSASPAFRSRASTPSRRSCSSGAPDLHLSPPFCGERSDRSCDPGERLSEESSCIGIGGTRIACFCVEADEQFVGQGDPDDHFGFSCGEQSVAESGKGVVVFSGDGGDQEEDRTDAGAAAADRSLALPLTTVIGERGEAGELGNGL